MVTFAKKPGGWQNYPSLLTPLDADGLNDLENRIGDMALESSDVATDRVQKVTVQSAETLNTPIFQVTPATPGFAPFHVQAQSYPNLGAGVGTYNHGVWFGFNASRFAGGASTAGKPGIYMGFEDNYFDNGGDNTYGPEWYVGYTTPDGTTIGSAGLRPFYCRIKSGNVNEAATAKSVATWIDIGGGATGFFSIMAGQVAGNELATFQPTATFIRKQTVITKDGVGLQVAPLAGTFAQADIIAPLAGGFPVLAFKVAGAYRWTLVGGTSSFDVQDQTNSARTHFTMVPGASDLTASSTFNSKLTVKGQQGSLTIAPTDAYAQIDLKAPGVGTAGAFAIIAFWNAGTPLWALQGTNSEIYLQDSVNSSRKHVQYLPGASDTAADTIFKSNVKVMGKFGCNGNTPVAKASAIATPTSDTVGTKAAIDAIRVALQNVGITS